MSQYITFTVSIHKNVFAIFLGILIGLFIIYLNRIYSEIILKRNSYNI